MKAQFVLPLDDSQADIPSAGGKGASLAVLARAGLPVPGGFHIVTQAYRRFIEANTLQAHIDKALQQVDLEVPSTFERASQQIREMILAGEMPGDIAQEISQAYEGLPGELPSVAVRSSATAEDLPDFSFAGLQETYLNIDSVPELLDAVRRCWASLWTARAIGYRMRHGFQGVSLSLAVVVQMMVPADASGVLFTANPVTGCRDQTVMNAAWGLGEAIVGGEVNPDTLTVDKGSGEVIERQIAEKEFMTVLVKGGTQTRQVPQDMRTIPVLQDEQSAELVSLGNTIEGLYERPMDIEWSLAGGQFYILQARPITALPEPEAPPPDKWQLPDPKGQYMRASIIDFMPDPLSPLYATLGLRKASQGMQKLLDRTIGKPEAMPDGWMMTINGYAYMSIRFTAKQWLQLSSLVPKLPGLLRRGEQSWREDALPRYQAVVQRWSARDARSLPALELFEGVDEILDVAMYYLTTLQAGLMGSSAFSEMVFTSVYDRLLRRPDDPPAAAYLIGFDSTPIRTEKDLYDLSGWVMERKSLADYLMATPSETLAQALGNGAAPASVPEADWQDWIQRLQRHLDEFGHTIYSLDIAVPVPADDPTPVLDTLKLYLRGQGKNPYERQQRLAEERQHEVERKRASLGWLRRRIFDKLLSFAQHNTPLREDSIAGIGLGWARIRAMLHELGRRMVEASALGKSDDIFWLEEDELREAAWRMDSGADLPEFFGKVSERRAIWRGRKRVIPPAQLPGKSKLMGINWEKYLPATSQVEGGRTLQGVGASSGKVTAPACVLHSPDDFDTLGSGEVLVAGITTPAWTPLFARAAAIVTDVGGPLSHGSIVAREYGIPAVLGTGVATRRIKSGQMITVDGDAGTVFLENGSGAEDERQPEA